MAYHAPVAGMAFTARCLGQDSLAATVLFAEATAETRDAILAEAAKMAETAVAPGQRAGDLHPARLENGIVRTSPGFAEAHRAIAEGGWIGIAASPESGGMGLPMSLLVMVNEMLASANLSLSLAPLLTQGQIEALESHAPDWIRAQWLPKLVSGEWTGTMNLTEPQAGSDVGAIASKAEATGAGRYRISGQKIYISWGDHDFGGNVLHLVLARLPGAPAGTRGLSLFLVPKLVEDAAGAWVPNGVRVVSLEHKMGLHGSPTCVMEFDGATGWLIGQENGGIACMFTMMNNARLGVGIEGVGVAEAAMQHALAWARDRRQGRTPDGSASILGHADVRRMAMGMISQTRAARAICYDCAFSLDMAKAAETAEARDAHSRRAAALTPIAKAFGTDTGNEVAQTGIQMHGGMGYIEETGAAQFARDVRVTAIYEGTNGIQAMDLVARKLSMDGGAAVMALLDEVAATVAATREAGHASLAAALDTARARAVEATGWMLGTAEMNDRFAGATPFLRMMALVLGAHHLLREALAEGEGDRLSLARFFVNHRLPEALAAAESAVQGTTDLYAIAEEALGA